MLNLGGDLTPILGSFSSTGTTSTVLAQTLAPPGAPTREKPALVRAYEFAVLVWVLTLALTLLFACIGCDLGIWTWVFLGAGLLAVLGPVHLRAHRTAILFHLASQANWQTQISRWSELRYCASCNSAIDVKRSRAVPAAQLGSLL